VFLEQVRRLHGLGAARAEPAAHRLAGKRTQTFEASDDDLLLVISVLERFLMPSVADELPLRLQDGIGERRVDIDDGGVGGGRGR
jgi:hypothetical protein